MKSLIVLISVLGGSAANAGNFAYDCKGADQDGDARSFWVGHSPVAAFVSTDEGDEYTIDREFDNSGTRKFAVYADREYDGYGGYVKVSLPNSVADAEKISSRPFTAYFTLATYSELGHVANLEITAKCVPAKLTGIVKSLDSEARKLSGQIPTAYWMSEADYLWSSFYSFSPVSDYQWQNNKVASALLAANQNIEVWSQKEVVEILNSVGEGTERAEYAALLKALKKQFKEFRGYKVGTPDGGALSLYIVGRNAQGYLVGVATITVET